MSNEFWERHVFVLLCPDTVHRGLAGPASREVTTEAEADLDLAPDTFAEYTSGVRLTGQLLL